jgi:hypothetical protein
MAPVFTLMEEVVLRKLREYVGWKDGEGDGIFSPGELLTNDFIERLPQNLTYFIRARELRVCNSGAGQQMER